MTKDQRDVLAVEMAHILKTPWEASDEALSVDGNGSIAFIVDNSIPAQELQGRLRLAVTRQAADMLGEAFVRAHLDAFLARAGNLLSGPMSRDHRHFGMKTLDHGTRLRFSFHASLLPRLRDDADADARPQGGRPSPVDPSKAPDVLGAASPLQFEEWLRDLSRLTPQAMYDELGRLGYVGQDEARKAVCLMAYRHVRRLQALHLEDVPAGSLPTKENLLLLGPTGCGKTYLVELLFRDILSIPTIVADMTTFTETGYVGDSVTALFPRLLEAAEGDARKAATGVICLDEFDKIAGASSRSPFAGQGTCKDVSGFGVQRELLRILESGSVELPGSRSAPPRTFSTTTVPFVACGAFSGLQAAIQDMSRSSRIGFGAEGRNTRPSRKEAAADAVSEVQTVPVAHFAAYGMIPELIGRFARIVAMQPVGPAQLREILERNTLSRYASELALDGMGLKVDDEAMETLVAECVNAGTGVRGLRNRLVRYLEDACFSAYSVPGKALRIRLTSDAGRVRAVVETKPTRHARGAAPVPRDPEVPAA